MTLTSTSSCLKWFALFLFSLSLHLFLSLLLPLLLRSRSIIGTHFLFPLARVSTDWGSRPWHRTRHTKCAPSYYTSAFFYSSTTGWLLSADAISRRPLHSTRTVKHSDTYLFLSLTCGRFTNQPRQVCRYGCGRAHARQDRCGKRLRFVLWHRPPKPLFYCALSWLLAIGIGVTALTHSRFKRPGVHYYFVFFCLFYCCGIALSKKSWIRNLGITKKNEKWTLRKHVEEETCHLAKAKKIRKG